MINREIEDVERILNEAGDALAPRINPKLCWFQGNTYKWHSPEIGWKFHCEGIKKS